MNFRLICHPLLSDAIIITTITQAAQERESLQREGDQLNEAIKVAEKEIRLLQRTLQSLVIRNDNFRASFHKVCARVCIDLFFAFCCFGVELPFNRALVFSFAFK